MYEYIIYNPLCLFKFSLFFFFIGAHGEVLNVTDIYVRGDVGVNACPSGFITITNEDACIVAATALGLVYDEGRSDGHENAVCNFCGGCNQKVVRLSNNHGNRAEWICLSKEWTKPTLSPSYFPQSSKPSQSPFEAPADLQLTSNPSSNDVYYISLGVGTCEMGDSDSQTDVSYEHGQGRECESMCTESSECHAYMVSMFNNCILVFAANITGVTSYDWGNAHCMLKIRRSVNPSVSPSMLPSFGPVPTQPSMSPSVEPTALPTMLPTLSPSTKPSNTPSSIPTTKPHETIASSGFQEAVLEIEMLSTSPFLTEDSRVKINISSTEPCSISWSINDAPVSDFDFIISYSNELVIKGIGNLPYGQPVDISVKATSTKDSSRTVQDSISLEINSPPQSGDCFLVQENPSVFAFQELTFDCNGWEDSHAPLTYDFVLSTPSQDVGLVLSQNQDSSRFYFIAPPGDFTITAYIRDSLGSKSQFPIHIASQLPSNLTEIQFALESSQDNLNEASESGDISSFAMNVALIDMTLNAVSTDSRERRRLFSGGDVRSSMFSSFKNLAPKIIEDMDLSQLAQILNSIFSTDYDVPSNILDDIIDSVNDIRFRSSTLNKASADPLLYVLDTLASSLTYDPDSHDLHNLVSRFEESAHGTFRDAIRDFVSGESYEIGRDGFHGSALRMAPDDDQALQACGGDSFDLPLKFSETFADESFDCITMESKHFPEMLIATPNIPLGGPQSLTLYGASQILNIPQEEFACDGFVIRQPIENSTNVTLLDDIMDVEKLEAPILLPKCAFFDLELQQWSSENCTVLQYDESEVICQCSHLTTFVAVLESFEPEINSLEKETWEEFTFGNIIAKPTPLILCFTVFLSIIFLYYVIGEKTNRPLIASKECLPKERRSELFEQCPEGIVHRLWTKEESNSFTKVWSLFRLKLRDNHIFFSMWTRNSFTNYSTKFRLLFFMVYLFTILLGSAIFYGQKQHHAASELFWIVFVAILGGRLVWVMEFTIKKSRPSFPVEDLIKKDLNFIGKNNSSFDAFDSALNLTDQTRFYTLKSASFFEDTEGIRGRFASETFDRTFSEDVSVMVVESMVRLETKRQPKISAQDDMKFVELDSLDRGSTFPRDMSLRSGGAMVQDLMSETSYSEFDEDRILAATIRVLSSPTDQENDIDPAESAARGVLSSPTFQAAKPDSCNSTLFDEPLEKRDTFYNNFGALMGLNVDTLEKKLRNHYELRESILREKYPLANYWRRRIVIFCLLYCLVACIFIMLFGLQFELNSDESPTDCSTANVEEVVNQAASVHWSQDTKIWPSYSFPHEWSTTARWLFSNLFAVLETLLIINPARFLFSAIFEVFLFNPVVSLLLFLQRYHAHCLCCCFRFSDVWTAAREIKRLPTSESVSSISKRSSNSSTMHLLAMKDPVTRFFTSHAKPDLRAAHNSSIELAVVE